jgi:hypothetical protein
MLMTSRPQPNPLRWKALALLVKLVERHRAQRDAARRRDAIARAINAYPSHAQRQELEAIASR